ncbi:hypothetical protein NL533_33530, partial [Klebsiella pneumoniae]|nr:hypothetical protein [Klebsiella pneumoniae]
AQTAQTIFWDLDAGTSIGNPIPMSATKAAWAPDGKSVMLADDHYVRLHEAPSGKSLASPMKRDEPATNVANLRATGEWAVWDKRT